MTYPEIFAHETVHERIDETVSIRQPKTSEVRQRVSLAFSVRVEGAEAWPEVEEQDERLQREPTHGEQHNDGHQHLGHLWDRVRKRKDKIQTPNRNSNINASLYIIRSISHIYYVFSVNF